jgi:hypothetical protein
LLILIRFKNGSQPEIIDTLGGVYFQEVSAVDGEIKSPAVYPLGWGARQISPMLC